MARLTEKQFWNLANEFHAYVKGEELVGHTINTVVLKRRYWPGFCKIYGRKVSWLPSFVETFYALRLFDLVEIVSKGCAPDVIVKEMVSKSVVTELLMELRAQIEKQSKKKSKLARKMWSGAILPWKRPSPSRTDRLEREVALGKYKVPSNVRNAVRAGMFLPNNLEQNNAYKPLKDLLKADLAFGNYSSKFDLLLDLEEIQKSQDIYRYNMTGVKMRKQGNMMYLKVPGLTKNYSPVFPGSCVSVTIESGVEQPQDRTQYKFYVYVVEPGCIGGEFSDDLLSQVTAQTRYNVRFTFSRYLMRLSHRAVNMELPEILLFPKQCKTLRSDIKITGADLSNPKIEDNKEQLQAVKNIVRGKESSVPYIIFGPPGTGKTVTMIEAIYQVIKNDEDSHILVCAHSNNACDHLTELLLKHVENGIVFRMHAASRNWADISNDVRLVSNYANGNFYFPPKKDLARYGIIICTLFTAGRLANAKFPDDHFTHVFIDEAGQATEPECMVGLGGILSKDGQVVLAGCSKLKPIVRSAEAKEYGLGVSYLQRLMDIPLYQKNPVSLGYNPQYITELSKNYRSQEASDQSLDQSQVFDFHSREGHCSKPVVIN